MAPWQPRGDAGRGVTLDCAWRSLQSQPAVLCHRGHQCSWARPDCVDEMGSCLGRWRGLGSPGWGLCSAGGRRALDWPRPHIGAWNGADECSGVLHPGTGSPFLTISGKMTKGEEVEPRHEVTLLPAAWVVRWDLDRTVWESRALLLVCTGVNTGMGGVLRWFGNGSFCRVGLGGRGRGASRCTQVERPFLGSSCGGDLRGEKVDGSPLCSAAPHCLASWWDAVWG